ncbi:hypothetical protein LTR78_006317 [Recurvomyces mirabilis]|uniref:Uncharacterized protein n=1 Tax=Recurvomyces mirabilis TaxID=574656 RepID=A0AAE1C0B5_9PEZI|nr:hypothetical protein LTR78_006317 [Recurvomyces mirabilis]KAK5152206.1 hypothetical protein LTS14_008581 [Recurvomyces mirabilis]
MDPEVARMMADLGVERRDYVSAPEFDRGQTMHENPTIAQEYEARRDRIINNAPEENEEAKFLRNWNNRALFERDELAENLQDRYSGQAHREALKAAVANGRYEHVDDERRPRRYVTSNAPNHNSFSSDFEPRSFANSNHAGKSGGHDGMRGRSAMKTAPNPICAPSPRAQGRLRFIHGQRVDVATMNGTAGALPPAPKAPAAARTLSNATSTATRSLPAVLTASTVPQPALTFTEEIALTAKKHRADWYAFNPGTESDDYYKKNPDEKALLRAAYIQCIKDALIAAKIPDSDAAAVVRGKSEKRAWMLKEAVKAKAWIENNQVAEANEYYTAHPQKIDFYKAAKVNFKPKVNDTTAAQVEALGDALKSTTLNTAATMSSSAVQALVLEDVNINSVAQKDATTVPASKPAVANNAASLAGPCVPPTGGTGTLVAKPTSPSRVILSAVSKKAASGHLVTTKPAIIEHGTANDGFVETSNGVKDSTTAPTTIGGVILGTFPGDRPALTIAAASPPTQQKENNGGVLGYLNACIRDALGNLMSKHTWPINNQDNMDVNAVASPQGLNPRNIISSMESLAENLRKISANANAQASADAAKAASESIEGFKDGGKTGYQGFEAEIMNKESDYGVPYGLQRVMEIMPDEDGLFDE